MPDDDQPLDWVEELRREHEATLVVGQRVKIDIGECRHFLVWHGTIEQGVTGVVIGTGPGFWGRAMTAVAYEVKIGAASGAASRARLLVCRSASSPERVRRHHIPSSIPRSQAYYWKHAWQNGEQETLRALATGEGVKFQGARAAIRWLLDLPRT